jgi:hypothetical protein
MALVSNVDDHCNGLSFTFRWFPTSRIDILRILMVRDEQIEILKELRCKVTDYLRRHALHGFFIC